MSKRRSRHQQVATTDQGREGEVLVEEPGEGGMHVRGRFDDAAVGRFSEFVV